MHTVDLRWLNISHMVSGRKFTKFSLFNAEGIVLDNAVYCFSISLLVPEIFAVKVESCLKTLNFRCVWHPKF